VQITLQLPKAISQVFQGLLPHFLLGCDVLVNYRIEARSPGQDWQHDRVDHAPARKRVALAMPLILAALGQLVVERPACSTSGLEE